MKRRRHARSVCFARKREKKGPPMEMERATTGSLPFREEKLSMRAVSWSYGSPGRSHWRGPLRQSNWHKIEIARARIDIDI